MTDSEPDAVSEDEAQPELCDWCGAVIDDGSELYAVVRDSSVVHAHDPKLDGGRMIVACSREHLRYLEEQYQRRPFIDAELWAGKIYRAMDEHPDGMSEEQLVEETGLTPAQIELGVLWQDLGALLWHQRFGQGGNADSPDERPLTGVTTMRMMLVVRSGRGVSWHVRPAAGKDADLGFVEGLAGEGGVLQREEVGGGRDGLESCLQEPETDADMASRCQHLPRTRRHSWPWSRRPSSPGQTSLVAGAAKCCHG